MNLLAFDYGASSGRGIIGKFDGKKLILQEIHRFSSDPVMVHGTFYWDILRLYHEMKVGVSKASLISKDIKSIGIDTWGVDFGLLDKKGQLISNPVHYRDNRTDEIMDEVFKIISKEEIYNETGIAFMQFNTIYQLYSLVKSNSNQLKSSKDLLFIPDLFRYFLTGEKSTEYSIASTSQLINKTTNSWSYEILEKLGIPKNLFSDVVSPGSKAGSLMKSISDDLSISQIPVIAIAEHDTASAVMAVPAKEERFCYISSGTWSLVGIEDEKSFINKIALANNFTNEGGFGFTNRLLKNVMGLWIYQECRRYWLKQGEEISFEAIDKMILEEKPLKSLINTDDKRFFKSGNMPKKIREFCIETGQSVPKTKGQIVRCIMESLALTYRMVIENLEDLISYDLPVIHIVGGGSVDSILCQFTANATGKYVEAGPVEATAIGNIIAQLIGLGEIASLKDGRELIRNSFESISYKPQDTKMWDEGYSRFKNILNIE